MHPVGKTRTLTSYQKFEFFGGTLELFELISSDHDYLALIIRQLESLPSQRSNRDSKVKQNVVKFIICYFSVSILGNDLSELSGK